MSDAAAPATGAKRPPGRPRTIDKKRILAAARLLDPDTLTMQALADALGVPRKTLHYHVQDREELLRLVAAETLKKSLSAPATPRSDDWRVALRAYAEHIRTSVIDAGRWMNYVHFEDRNDFLELANAERMLNTLVNAGFDEQTAGLALGLAAQVSLSSAQDVLARREQGRHPQAEQLQEALSQAGPTEYTRLRRLAESGLDAFGSDHQFEFDVRILTLGLEQTLAAT